MLFRSVPNSNSSESGTNGNTLEEAIYTARLVGPVMAEYLLEEKRE